MSGLAQLDAHYFIPVYISIACTCFTSVLR
jgi:hypothetical protein